MDTSDERYQRARKYVKKLKAFYLHAIIFGLVNGGLILLNLVTSSNHWWSLWSIFGWGIGLLAHGASVFLFAPGNPIFGDHWEERRIEEYLAQQRKKDP
jgi:hypothetical protein